MLLAAPADVVATQGLASTTGTLAAAQAALDMAFPVMETVLETSLSYGQVTDYYDAPSVPGPEDDYLVILRLTNRFIDPDTVVVSATIYGEVTGITDYTLDAQAGIITFLTSLLPSRVSVAVTYEHGLDDPGAGKVAEYPSWVAKAAVSAAVLSLNTHPATPAIRKDKTVYSATSALHGHLRLQTQQYTRPRLNVVFPTRSEKFDV